jgi:hypothetical protein
MDEPEDVCDSADLRFDAAKCKVDVTKDGVRFRACWNCELCGQSGSSAMNYTSRDTAMASAHILAMSHWQGEHARKTL